MFELGVVKLKEMQQAMSNHVFFAPRLLAELQKLNRGRAPVYVQLSERIYVADGSPHVEEGCVALSQKQRENLKLSVTLDRVAVSRFELPNTEYRLAVLKTELQPLKPDRPAELAHEALERAFRALYTSQFFSVGQEVLFEAEGVQVYARVALTGLVESEAKRAELPFGMVCADTQLEFSARGGQTLRVRGGSSALRNIVRADFKFEELGVGGLDREIADIFRRAFSSRRIPAHILELYGIKHVKGLLLHGPPGTGKTLIARQLGRVLQAREPKVVNGPELFNKYVGETEANMRKLFEDARRDYLALKEDSPLHIIIFDEFDAIAKHRGLDAGGTGVADNTVNQLLSIMDGVETLNNILVIGMTNRLDLIDKAVLRSGRFEVHVEVGLPDEAGRAQILAIHTQAMRRNGLLGPDVDLGALAAQMKNYTGAEIEAVVKSASSWALNRHHNLMDFAAVRALTTPGRVERPDFERALAEVRPEFGVEEDKLAAFTAQPLVPFGARLQALMGSAQRALSEALEGRARLLSLLLHGAEGTGKTTLAVRLALEARFPFVKLVSAEDLIGRSESAKVALLARCFEDAYKSRRSLLILDDVERLCEYVEAGRRFSSALLQAVLVLIKKQPPKAGHCLAVVGTSSNLAFMREFGLATAFNVRLEVPELSFAHNGENEILAVLRHAGLPAPRDPLLGQRPGFRLGIKKLLFVIGLVRQGGKGGSFEEEFAAAVELAGADLTDELTALGLSG